MLRRWVWLLVIVLILSAAPAARAENPPALPLRAYLLMDAATGNVLYEHQGNVRLSIASTTKIMTGIVALERGGDLQSVATIGSKPYNTGGSSIYLELGEKQTLENLMYALMLESANDSAVAIAEHIAGTEEAFVVLMNEKAREIGVKDTRFANSHGLDEPGHYSTAFDLALIARYAMRNPRFREMVATEEKVIPGYDTNPPRKLWNHNRLLGYYEGANGVKNGYTEDALQTNVASARRGDTELIAVALGAQNRLWTSSMALLDFGFSHFRTVPIVQKGEIVATVNVPGAPAKVGAVAARDLSLSLPAGQPRPETRTVWDTAVKAPLATGVKLGQLQVLQEGKVVAEVELVTGDAVARTLAGTVSSATRNAAKWWVLTALLLALGAGVGVWAARRSAERRREVVPWLRRP